MISASARATAGLAEFVAGTSYSSLPGDVLRHARLVIADTIGVALRGSTEPEMTQLYRRLPPEPEAMVWADVQQWTGEGAASAANATAISFMELDEGTRPTGHPALHVLPVCLARAQAHHATGEDTITAFVLGYEVQSRIQSATRLRPVVHPHGNFGVPAAVAAIGKLSGWDAERMTQGLRAAGSFTLASSWRPCLAGATVRNAYAGAAASLSFLVGTLVESGFSAYDDSIGETFGEILGDAFDPAVLVDGLGVRYRILDNYFKFHAACALAHPALDALADAMGAPQVPGTYPSRGFLPLEPDRIDKVTARVAHRCLRLACEDAGNQLSAKFSLPYAIAAYLVRGQTGPECFAEPTLSDPTVRAILPRIAIEADSRLDRRWPREAAAEVTVKLTSGVQLVGRCSNPFGSSGNPAAEADLRAKFDALTASVLTSERQTALWSDVQRIDSYSDMRDFAACLNGSARVP